MKIQLSDHFTYKRLIRFVFPSIIMMICTSMYSIIDGLFISNFAGKTAFAASAVLQAGGGAPSAPGSIALGEASGLHTKAKFMRLFQVFSKPLP